MLFNLLLLLSSFVLSSSVTGYQLTTITLPKAEADDEVKNWGKIEFNNTISGTNTQSNHTNTNDNASKQSTSQNQYNRQQNDQMSQSGQSNFQEEHHQQYRDEQPKPYRLATGQTDFHNQTQSNYDHRFTGSASESGQNNTNNQSTSNAQSTGDNNVRYDWTIKGYNATQWGTPPKDQKEESQVKVTKLTPIVIED